MSKPNEETVELAAIDFFQQIGYQYMHGGVIAPGEAQAERNDYREVLLVGRLRAALAHINVHIPLAVHSAVVDEVIRRLQRREQPKLIQNNHAFHKLLVEGVDVSFRHNGKVQHDKLWLLDFAQPDNNDWLVVNQFTVEDVNPRSRAKTNRRPDVVAFVNGLPLGLLELKNATDEQATTRDAFTRLQTYKQDIGSICAYNAVMVASDGLEALLGTLTAGWEWFKPWRSVDGVALDPHSLQLQTLIEGVFTPATFLDILRYFIVFEQKGKKGKETTRIQTVKKVAQYHQYGKMGPTEQRIGLS